MGSGRLRNLPFVSRPPEAARERAEPRLLAANMPVSRQPAEVWATGSRPAEVRPRPLTNLRNDGPRLGVAPVVSAADRQPVSSGKQETGPRRYAALAAVVALAIGAFGAIAGTALLSPAPSEKKTIATAGPPDDPNPSGADRSTSPVPAPALTPRPVAAGIPGMVGEQHKPKPMASKAPVDVSNSALPASAVKPTPLVAALPPEKPVHLVKSTAVPEIVPSSAATRKEAQPKPVAVRLPAETGRPTHPQVAGHHAHSRSAREARSISPASSPEHASTARHSERATRAAETLTPPSGVGSESVASAQHSQRAPRTAENSASPASSDRAAATRHSQRASSPGEGSTETAAQQPSNQTAEFDQLLAHLTGSTRPAAEPGAGAPPPRSASTPPPFLGQSLTPPGPGAPDPFASRSLDRPSPQ
jgi:hypothetical protein